MTSSSEVPPPKPPPPQPVVRMAGSRWDIANAAQLWELAGHVNKAELKPKGVKSQADVFLLMAYGQTYGYSEMEALQTLNVVKGRVGLPAQAMVAKVLSHPLCRDHRMWLEGEGEERTGCVQSWRLGRERANDVVRFSLAEARAAWLYDPEWRDTNKEPSNWVKYTDDQLLWKAAIRDFRRNWSDAYGHRVMSTEELREIARSERAALEDDDDAIDVGPLAPRAAAPPPASSVLQQLAAGASPIAFELPKAPERELALRSPEQQRNIDAVHARMARYQELPSDAPAPVHASAPAQQLTLDVEPLPPQPEEPLPPPEAPLMPGILAAIKRAAGDLLPQHRERALRELERHAIEMRSQGRTVVDTLAEIRGWKPKW